METESQSQPKQVTGRGRRLILLGVVLLVGATVAVVLSRRESHLPRRFAAVQPGVLYRCGQPTVDQIKNARKEHGIRTLFIVREADGKKVQAEMAWAKSEPGIRLIHAPIESREPVPQERVEEFFKAVDDPANQPVLIHCSAGRHRTGFLCAMYRIERQGWSVEEAVAEMLSFKFGEKGHAAILKQLRAYVPIRDRKSGPAEASSKPTQVESSSASEGARPDVPAGE